MRDDSSPEGNGYVKIEHWYITKMKPARPVTEG
jgi:hypothetical protein